ncbi:hypothetical protein O6H91_10G018000 [Diphasiastrum complanatum]|uniref:Uncharacterized protein n=1 Tax=Diphasiastrum complanatum TaxID=34168 RepID=A0ACC2CEL5_DIPCM|nr:hypothetical protein O6H91_10G018000 [Diphasiastrum complanatum]
MDQKKCELCTAQAELYCSADDAYVCWDCDAQVHGANFLVARHHRSVLCRNCSSPTLWRASGTPFHRTSRLCPSCSSGNVERPHRSNNKRTRSCKRPDVSMVHSTSLSLGGSDIICSKLEHIDQKFLDQDCNSHIPEQCTCMVSQNKNVLASLTSYSTVSLIVEEPWSRQSHTSDVSSSDSESVSSTTSSSNV